MAIMKDSVENILTSSKKKKKERKLYHFEVQVSSLKTVYWQEKDD